MSTALKDLLLTVLCFYGFQTEAQLMVTPKVLLPSVNVDPASVTVSGLSSGAFMAVQLGVAYSAQIHGVAAIAGGIYNCAEGQTKIATDLCMKAPQNINVEKHVLQVRDAFAQGEIDNPSNMGTQKILIVNGLQDKTLLPEAGHKLEEFYKTFGALTTSEFTLNLGHGFPSSKGKNKCEATQFPWLNDCTDFKAAEKILGTFYAPLLSAVPATNAKVMTFDQTEFESKNAMMAETGNVFVPPACLAPGAHCRLHVALHGCMQNPLVAQKAFVEDAGYNEWAEANNIVILYPAATIGKGNPNGCWDWFGFTSASYATKTSLQMTSIMKMIARLGQPLILPEQAKE